MITVGMHEQTPLDVDELDMRDFEDEVDEDLLLLKVLLWVSDAELVVELLLLDALDDPDDTWILDVALEVVDEWSEDNVELTDLLLCVNEEVWLLTELDEVRESEELEEDSVDDVL
jgi:hypothetical protein